VTQRVIDIFSRANSGVDILTQTVAPPAPDRPEGVIKAGEAYLEVARRGGRLRILTRINESNMAFCKELAKIVQVRHLDEVTGNFAVTDSEYVSSPSEMAFQLDAMVSVVYSNTRLLVEQNRSAFESLWNKAQSSEERIAELEQNRPHRETKIIRGEQNVVEFIAPFLSRAAAAGPEPHAYGTSDLLTTLRASEGAYFEVTRSLMRQNPGFRILNITDIQKQNLDAVKRLIETGYEVRHIDNNRIRFSVSKDEYIEVIHTKAPGGTADEIMWSNDPQVVAQATRMFDALWNSAIPAGLRIREIEEGSGVPTRTEVIRDPPRTQKLYLDLIAQAKDEILVILPTANAYQRQLKMGAVDALTSASVDRGVKVKIIAPGAPVLRSLEALSKTVERKAGKKMLDHRRILDANTPNTVTVLVADRSVSLVVELRDDSQADFERAMGVATYSTRNPTVLANVRFFERLWEEVELRHSLENALEHERRSRKTAELLQDILSHDIRNYNQVSIISAELLREDLRKNGETLEEASRLVDALARQSDGSGDFGGKAQKARTLLEDSAGTLKDADELVERIVGATSGSSGLIDTAKKLGRIMSQEVVTLHPVDLEASIRRSLELIEKANPAKQVRATLPPASGARVIADEMLGEVFTNLLSNSVSYSKGDEAVIEVTIEDDVLDGTAGRYWRVSLADRGRGIPDEKKGKVFARYLKTASGSGLGLSIVYALVVERYSGRIAIADRVPGDYTEGTRIQVWLPKAA
jgi:signal transduction histidine kinase